MPPERQKILGLVKGKLPSDEVTMFVTHSRFTMTGVLILNIIYCSRDLKLSIGKKFTLIGTPEGHEIKDPSRESRIQLSIHTFHIVSDH